MRQQGCRPSLIAYATPRLWALALVLAVYVAVCPAQAQRQREREYPPAPQFISQFGITEAMFATLCDALDLTPTQRAQASQRHAEYIRVAGEYSKELYQRMLDGGLRDYWDAYADAQDTGEPTPVERMNELHAQYARIRFEGYARADQIDAEFYADLTDMLEPPQATRMESAQRLMRRLNWQHRRLGDLKAGGSHFGPFSMDLIDPFQLWSDAMKSLPADRAVSRLPCLSSHDVLDPATFEEGDPRRTLSHELRDVLATYEVQFDGIMLARMSELRRPQNVNEGGVTSTDAPRWQRTIRRWAEEQRILDRCMLGLTEVLRRLENDEAAREFHDAFLREFCPDLMNERWPDRMVKWISDRADAAPEQIAAAEKLYADYTIEMRQLRDLAIEAGVEARRNHLHAEGNEPEQQLYSLRKRDMRQLIDRTLVSFRGLLREEQLGDFDDQAFGDLFRYYRHLAGPGGGGLERIGELLKPPTSIDELDRREVERRRKLEEEQAGRK